MLVEQSILSIIFHLDGEKFEGIHDRGNFDLSNHSRQSQKELSLKDPENQSNHIPYVIETSVGVERTFLAFALRCLRESRRWQRRKF